MNSTQENFPITETIPLHLLEAKRHTLATPEEAQQVTANIQAGKKHTAVELGQLRRKFFTREFPRIKTCGHKYIPNTAPHGKCEACWHAYFIGTEGLLTKTLQIVAEKGAEGTAQLTATYGTKWVKALDRFITKALAAKALADSAEATEHSAQTQAA